MEEKDRIETKRETTVNAAGEVTSETITYEPKIVQRKLDKRDYLDSIIKIVGVIGIAIPIWLFYSQQNNEFERQKAVMEFEADSKLSIELHRYSAKTKLYNADYFNELEKSKDLLLLELIPKSRLFKNDSLIGFINSFENKVAVIYFYFKSLIYQDSILIFTSNYKLFSKHDKKNRLYTNWYLSIYNFIHYTRPSFLSYLDSSKDDIALRESLLFNEKALSEVETSLVRSNVANEIDSGMDSSTENYRRHEYLRMEGNMDTTADSCITRIKDKFDKEIYEFDKMMIKTNRLAH